MEELSETTPASPEPTSGGLDLGALKPWHVLILLFLVAVVGAIVLTVVLVAKSARKNLQQPTYPPPGPQQWQGYPPQAGPQQPSPGTPPQPPADPQQSS